MDKLKSAALYLQVLEDIVNSKEYFQLDDETVGKMNKTLEFKKVIDTRIVENDTTVDKVYKSAIRIHNLISEDDNNDVIIKKFVQDINATFDIYIDRHVLYYDVPLGSTLPEKRPFRYEAHYRTDERSRTEYVNIIAYSEEEATKIFKHYMKECGYLDKIDHSEHASYEGPLYHYEEVGSIVGANWY